MLRMIPKPTPKTVTTSTMHRMTARLRPRTPTPPLTATKPMAIWIMTVNPMMLRMIPNLTQTMMITMKMKTPESWKNTLTRTPIIVTKMKPQMTANLNVTKRKKNKLSKKIKKQQNELRMKLKMPMLKTLIKMLTMPQNPKTRILQKMALSNKANLQMQTAQTR